MHIVCDFSKGDQENLQAALDQTNLVPARNRYIKTLHTPVFVFAVQYILLINENAEGEWANNERVWSKKGSFNKILAFI